MRLLDAFALIALVREEPAAGAVEDLLRAEPAAMASINFAEAFDHLLRGPAGEAEVRRVVDPLVDEAVRIVPLDRAVADAAAVLRARHYSSRRRAVSLADCVCAATAAQLDAPVATHDRALLELCADEGIPVIELPR